MNPLRKLTAEDDDDAANFERLMLNKDIGKVNYFTAARNDQRQLGKE